MNHTYLEFTFTVCGFEEDVQNLKHVNRKSGGFLGFFF